MHNYIYIYIYKQKDVSMFHKDVSHQASQKYFYVGFAPEHTKNMRIGGCAGLLGNYSISKIKLYRDQTSAQAKNGFPSSHDISLESKWKMLWKLYCIES